MAPAGGVPSCPSKAISCAEPEGGEAYHTGRPPGRGPPQSAAGDEQRGCGRCCTSCLPTSGAHWTRAAGLAHANVMCAWRTQPHGREHSRSVVHKASSPDPPGETTSPQLSPPRASNHSDGQDRAAGIVWVSPCACLSCVHWVQYPCGQSCSSVADQCKQTATRTVHLGLLRLGASRREK